MATLSILRPQCMAMARRRSMQRRITCPIRCCSLIFVPEAGTGAMMAGGMDGVAETIASVAETIASVTGPAVGNIAAIAEKGAATVGAAATTAVIDRQT